MYCVAVLRDACGSLHATSTEPTQCTDAYAGCGQLKADYGCDDEIEKDW